ncbi:YecR family lipoprotein, partial [Bacillus cereus group sp. BC327]
LLLLAGCTITRQAEVSHVDAPNGVVRLNYNQAMLQNARYDAYLTNGTATRECQSMGYATASFYGEPIKTCSLVSGSVCLNETMTIQYKCLGY